MHTLVLHSSTGSRPLTPRDIIHSRLTRSAFEPPQEVRAAIPASHPEGYDCQFIGEIWPAMFFKGEVLQADGSTRLTLSTGSGPQIGEFLEKLLQGFAGGLVRLDHLPDSVKVLQDYIALPDGRPCTLSRTADGLYEPATPEGVDWRGKPIVGTSLYFKRRKLAEETARQVRNGMLGFDD